MNKHLMKLIEEKAEELTTLLELIPHHDTKRACTLVKDATDLAKDVISRTDLNKMQAWARLLLNVTNAE